MSTCPACGKATAADALACRHCGISLHPDAPTRNRSENSGGASTLGIVLVIGGAVVAALILLVLGVGLFTIRSVAVPTAVRHPAGSTIAVPATSTIAVEQAEPESETKEVEPGAGQPRLDETSTLQP